MGSALSALGRLAEAQEAYEEAQRQRPEDSDVTWCEIYERNNGLLSIVFDEYIMRIYIYICDSCDSVGLLRTFRWSGFGDS